MVAWNKRKRKKLQDTVHPDILERARVANERTNEHLEALRKRGYTRKALVNGAVVDVQAPGGVSLDTSVLLVEGASIIKTMEGYKKDG